MLPLIGILVFGALAFFAGGETAKNDQAASQVEQAQ